MSTWEPGWKADPNPQPKPILYEWLDPTTHETIFNVEVSAIGAIQVVEDDWLSRYAEAIHDDFDVTDRFIRRQPKDGVYTIDNVDLIARLQTSDRNVHVPSA